jgi:hypothetical protein
VILREEASPTFGGAFGYGEVDVREVETQQP